MQHINSRRGFSLIQVLVVFGLIGIAAMVLSELGQVFNKTMRRQQETGALLAIQSKTASLSRDVIGWVSVMRTNPTTSAWAGTCLPPTPGATYAWGNCPVATLTPSVDADLPATGSYPHRYSVALVDLAGEALTGTEATPLLVNGDGALCSATPEQCRFEMVGFMLSSLPPNVAPGPGSVRFVVRMRRIEQATADNRVVFKPRYLTIDVGESWSSDLVPTLCGPSQVLTGIGSDKSPICKALSIRTISGIRYRGGPSEYWDASSGFGLGREWLGAGYRPDYARPSTGLKVTTNCSSPPSAGSNNWLKSYWTNMCKDYKDFKAATPGSTVYNNKRASFRRNKAIIVGPIYGEWQMGAGSSLTNPDTWLDDDDIAASDAGSYNDLPEPRQTEWETKIIAQAPPRGCTHEARGVIPDEHRCFPDRPIYPSSFAKGYIFGAYIVPSQPSNWDQRDPNMLVDYNNTVTFGQLCPRGFVVASCLRSSAGVTNTKNAEYDASIINISIAGKRFGIGCATNDYSQIKTAGVRLQTNCMKIELSDP